MSFLKRPAGAWGSQRTRSTRNRRRPDTLEVLEGRLVLSTFFVDSLADTVAVNLQTGKDSTGHITLRSAIMAANHSTGQDTIKLPSGTITLTITGNQDDQAFSGDLDINGDLKIEGQGADKTIIDGNNIDRVIEVLSGQVSLSNLTIQNGREVDNGGGGLKNDRGNVTLTSVNLLGNKVVADNGANGSAGLNGGNGGVGTSGLASQGGAIFNGLGTLTLVDTTISSNQAIGGNGGSGGTGATNIGASGGIAKPGKDATGGIGGNGGNGGSAAGGAIFNSVGGVVNISGGTIIGNQALGGRGGNGGLGGNGTGGNGGLADGTFPGAAGGGTGGTGGVAGNGGGALGGAIFNAGTLTFSDNTTTFTSNVANGGFGGNGGTGGNAVGGNAGQSLDDHFLSGTGGKGFGGFGGKGGNGGGAFGGAIDNNGTLNSTASVTFASNLALGGRGGVGGTGGTGTGGIGGESGFVSGTGAGGVGVGGGGSGGGNSGVAEGGGLFNDINRVAKFLSPDNTTSRTILFAGNRAIADSAGAGGLGGAAFGGRGGTNELSDSGARGGQGGNADSGNGGHGGVGGNAFGGGLDNHGDASFLGVTLNVNSANLAQGGVGGAGGNGGNAHGGQGGKGDDGGNGGKALVFHAGDGGNGGNASGGGIFESGSSLIIRPRQGAKAGTPQALATNVITNDQAILGAGGVGGTPGIPTAGLGGPGHHKTGLSGTTQLGFHGNTGTPGTGIGGGVTNTTILIIDDTIITGNKASTRSNDLDGAFAT